MNEYRNKIVSFYRNKKRMPSYQEIMDLLGFKSKNAVYKLVNKLVAEKIVSKDGQGRLIPNKLTGEIPLLGLVEAGIPTATDEVALDTMSLDEYLVSNPDKSFILRVKGDSMIEEGIREGDLVVVERKENPKEGDIVIAEVDGGWTMKFLRKKSGKNYLEPANRNYKPIYPEYDLRIAAVVKGVIRKY
ncbi:MAG: transcriptional repressor LexA [bacterium]|nr:transcriptional repressor LexA [bacterium]